MTWFPDTSFLCSLYREQSHSPQVDSFMETTGEPLPISSLVLFEFRYSIRLQQRLFKQDRSIGISKAEAKTVLATIDSDLRTGILKTETVDWADVHQIAEELSKKYTAEKNHRFADILHVATGLHLGHKGFLSFDKNQRSLAEAEGLTLL